MDRVRALLIIALTATITTALNTSLGTVPPLGKILDPFQGFWHNAETKTISIPRRLKLPALEAPVTVQFDKHLIPHITAQNDHDLYLAQGYITAFHRLWQMDFQTYAAAGRISELVGPLALNFDRLQRRKGNLHTAQNCLENIKSKELAYKIVKAYAAGINAYIRTLSYKDLPVEYKLLNYRPEPWTPHKVTLMMVQMIDELCGDHVSLKNTHAYHQLGKEKFDFLFPEHFRQNEPVIPQNTPWRFKSPTLKAPSLVVPQLTKPLQQPQQSRTSGSNNWAVSGTKTASGTPYLANDPHLAMQLPAIWYSIHLQSPTVNVLGASIPGLPGVVIGFNEKIAWGVTNTTRSVKDWYTIQFKDKTRKEYHYDHLLLKSQFVTEEIKVKGQANFYDTVVHTHLGPVVYDEHFPALQGSENLAMKWVGHHPNQEPLALYWLNRAQNAQDIDTALQDYDAPSQNFAFASVHNDIGMQIAGRFPAKWRQQGRFVMPGHSSAYAWQETIPKAHNPRLLNPTTGYVSSANQRAAGSNYPYYYYHYREELYRNRRINKVLRGLKDINEKDMMKLQLDNFNLMAQESLPLLMSHVDTTQLSTEQQATYQQLLDWDRYNDADQLAPSIFKAWKDQLEATLWKPLCDASVPKPYFYRTVEILRDHPNNPHLTLGPYATVGELIHHTFVAALQQLEAWQIKHQKPYRWGDYAPVWINHLASIPSFGLAGLQVGGGENIVNANFGNIGASLRIVVDLNKKPRGWLVYPGGQSGNPGSPYYTHLVDLWEQGQYIPVTINKENAQNALRTFVLQPAK